MIDVFHCFGRFLGVCTLSVLNIRLYVSLLKTKKHFKIAFQAVKQVTEQKI